jgi:hypothetical protein
MRRLLWVPILLSACAGGGSARYGEADNGQTISADLDTTFYVSLPDTMTAKAACSSNVLRLAKDGVDGATHTRTLEFTAIGLGETVIRVGAGFSLRVKVAAASDRPGMHVHTR